MTVRKLLLLPLLWLLPALIGGYSGAAPQQPAIAGTARALALTQTMPVDPSITTGRLPNGLRYYIRANKTPLNRAELRLAVNAGSVLEDPDQLGLAHFVEHMAFNGTRHFPKQDLVKFMESIGMQLGPDLNADTSFDETVYMLRVPTDNARGAGQGLLILADWAQSMTFDPAEIDKERGVIIEEWRLSRGADARMQDKQLPVLLQGSRYADRLPIGKKEILEKFKPESLRRFYTDWYRPDLMAVVAVGDFDTARIESLIRQDFSPIPAPKAPRPRPTYDVPDHPRTLYAIATDKEATMTTLSVYNKLPLRDQTTVGVVPPADCRAALRGDDQQPPDGHHAETGRAIRHGRRGAGHLRSHQGSGDPERGSSRGRGRGIAQDAARRVGPRGEVRLHRHGAGAAEARSPADL